jgi:hypothetical protein
MGLLSTYLSFSTKFSAKKMAAFAAIFLSSYRLLLITDAAC